MMKFRNLVTSLAVLVVLTALLAGPASALAAHMGDKAMPARPSPTAAQTAAPMAVTGGDIGITLPPGMTLGAGGKVMPASEVPKFEARPGGGPQGIMTPPGTTMGPGGKIVPVGSPEVTVPRMNQPR